MARIPPLRMKEAAAKAAPDPAGSEGVETPGVADRLADLAKSAPGVSQLGDFSPAYAIRWLFWLLAVLGSLAGLGLTVLGTLALVWMLGPLSASAQAALGDASLGAGSAAGGLDAALPLTVVIANVTNSTGDSLLNLSSGLNSMGDGLDKLSRVGGTDTGLGASAGYMRAAASSLGPAIVSLQGAGQSASDLSARLSEAGDSVRRISSDLDAARRSVGASVLYAQMGVLALGAAMAAMLSGVLMLALAYGPPKKN